MNLPNLSDSLTAARALLGWKLIHKTAEGTTSGYIVETESYDMHDPASHAYGGMRKRNAAMYEVAGTIYVYFTYGMHYCINIVTGEKGHGQGVLIRALEPVDGIELMKHRRGTENLRILTNGPGKLAQAMGINMSQYGHLLNKGDILLEPGFTPAKITQTTRIGISKAVDHPWRFYVTGNQFVSKR